MVAFAAAWRRASSSFAARDSACHEERRRRQGWAAARVAPPPTPFTHGQLVADGALLRALRLCARRVRLHLARQLVAPLALRLLPGRLARALLLCEGALGSLKGTGEGAGEGS